MATNKTATKKQKTVPRDVLIMRWTYALTIAQKMERLSILTGKDADAEHYRRSADRMRENLRKEGITPVSGRRS